ncbi:PEP-CTERM sorting domain-containing protein [Bradyrhizobium sp. INPA01-394B]|uniref:PEP-CTERM sorting domain-containing protein n=1 Tax=Bradyrhizobium campsiandrae TaxID=1729892 RepID=A0ABR7UKC4_9BRAD|nr:PEP-CTERM sorting domain-containing protein [Bradyrhizobium campsiandrae]MBC9879411.1 PEP-CTERM sorting domain-containing protein [Bradyrhizobium campsiandrae]MBC9984060.1 PEP-CTERM sorting domain-containing protein [Bradyrhizobium campsiandrae]
MRMGAATLLIAFWAAIAPGQSQAASVTTDFPFGTDRTSVPVTAYDGDPSHFGEVAFFNSFNTSSTFKPSLGTLTSVNIFVSARYTFTSPFSINPLPLTISHNFGEPFFLNAGPTTFNAALTDPVTIPGLGSLFQASFGDSFSLPTITNPFSLSLLTLPQFSQDQVFFNEGGRVVPLTSIAISGDAQITYTYTPVAAVPEPSTWIMLLLGFAGCATIARRSAGIARGVIRR